MPLSAPALRVRVGIHTGLMTGSTRKLGRSSEPEDQIRCRKRRSSGAGELLAAVACFDRPAVPQTEDEEDKSERADGKEGVTGDAQPAQRLHQRRLQEDLAACIPVA